MQYRELADFLEHVGKDPSRLIFEDELNNTFYETLDDVRSPSNGLPVPGDINSSGSLFFDAEKLEWAGAGGLGLSFALGGLGSGICRTADELEALAVKAFAHTGQVLVEEYLAGGRPEQAMQMIEVALEAARRANPEIRVDYGIPEDRYLGSGTSESTARRRR